MHRVYYTQNIHWLLDIRLGSHVKGLFEDGIKFVRNSYFLYYTVFNLTQNIWKSYLIVSDA